MLISMLIFAILAILDQVTKYLAQVLLVTEGSSKTLIPNFLNAKLIYNRGAAWGMLEDNTPVLAVISLIAGIALGYYVLKNNWKTEKLKSIGLTLAFTGCIGNLIDRVAASFKVPARIGVVDMIDFEPLNWFARLLHQGGFPIFNLADAYLVVGLILFAIDLIFFAERRAKNVSKH